MSFPLTIKTLSGRQYKINYDPENKDREMTVKELL